MIGQLIALAIVVAALAIAVALICKQQQARSLSAEVLEQTLTEGAVKQAIREDVAPQFRPYTPGQFGNDSAGHHYVAGTDGAIRRVAIVETQEGPAIFTIKKLGKAGRKQRKREIRAQRTSGVCAAGPVHTA